MMIYRDKLTGNTLTVNNEAVAAMMDANSGRYVRLEDAPAKAVESAEPAQKKTRRRK